MRIGSAAHPPVETLYTPTQAKSRGNGNRGKRKPGLVNGVCFCRPPGQLPVCASSVRKGRFAVLSFAVVTAKKWCSICRVTLAVADRRVGIGLIMHGAISPYRR
jgi:hypothetical protein